MPFSPRTRLASARWSVTACNVSEKSRPDESAARPETAIPLYEQFCRSLSDALGKPVATGQFGADMKVTLLNDGPVTICMDTKNKE